MKDLVIKADQLQQLFAFLQEQPHKFSAPMIAFFQQLMQEQERVQKTDEVVPVPEQIAE
jgi:hypothetical protein